MAFFKAWSWNASIFPNPYFVVSFKLHFSRCFDVLFFCLVLGLAFIRYPPVPVAMNDILHLPKQSLYGALC